MRSKQHDGRTARAVWLGLMTVAATATLAHTFSAHANPAGGTVVQGDATISTPNPTTTQIDQSSDKAMIEWSSFDIDAGEATIFNQPNSSSVTLNRIFDQNPSIIAGHISANGRIILINANGMVFENGATVNAAGLLATSADIGNEDFMAGNYRFETPGSASAQIVNKGLITAEEAGVVAFVAPSVRNSGVITAKLGRVELAGAKTFILDLHGDSLISFPISTDQVADLLDGSANSVLVDVSGKIDAASVKLTARAARGIVDRVINVDGEITATGAARSGAGIELTGDGRLADNHGRYGSAIRLDAGAFGGVQMNGRLDASATEGGAVSIVGSTVNVSGSISARGTSGKGGTVTINGSKLNLVDAKVDVSGASGGGSIAIGHDGRGASGAISADTVFVSQNTSLNADALDRGDGGRVVLWSNLATDFRGSLSAKGGAVSGNGGFLEVSSKGAVGFSGAGDASAPHGVAGQLTLDPKNIIISNTGVGLGLPGLTDPNDLTFGQSPTSTLTVNPGAITATLNTGTAVTLQASNDISVLSDIIINRNFGDGGTLTLEAGRSITLDADIVTDDGNLFIIANAALSSGVIDAQRDPGNAVFTMGVGASITAGVGDVRITVAPGAGKTHAQSGSMTLRDISGNRVVVENLGPSNGGIVIAGGQIEGTSTGTAVVLAAQGGNFVNNAGANAISTPNGQWVVYSQTPLANTAGGLPGVPYYNRAYNPADPRSLTTDSNRFAYTLAPVLTVRANNQSREYGEYNPDLTWTITGFVGDDDPALAIEGEPFVSTTANERTTVGQYAITVDPQTLASDYNYGFSLVDAVLNVVPAQLYYVAVDSSREYGEANPELDGDLFGIKLDDTAADVVSGTMVFGTSASETSNAGRHEIDGSGLTVINSNYALTILQDASNSDALEITPAQLTFEADFIEREYGDANNLTGVVTGLKNGDALASVTDGTLVWTSSATELSPLGIYSVTGGGLTVTTTNYRPTILQHEDNAFALTVTPAQLIYVADPRERDYGQLNPTFTGSIQGLKNGDTLASVTDGTVIWTGTAVDISDAGTYGIFGSGLTITSGNYFLDIEQAPQNASAFVIHQVQLTYIADPKQRVFKEPDFFTLVDFTGRVVGITNGDSLENITSGDLIFATPASNTSSEGSYPIFGEGLTVTSPNYFMNILQAPGNATALRVIEVKVGEEAQIEEEIVNGDASQLDGELTTMASRSNALGIIGVQPVAIDLNDGQIDDLTAQLCILGALMDGHCRLPQPVN